MSEDGDLLRQALERLDATTAELAAGDVGAERARELAEQAMALSAEISELVARVLRADAP